MVVDLSCNLERSLDKELHHLDLKTRSTGELDSSRDHAIDWMAMFRRIPHRFLCRTSDLDYRLRPWEVNSLTPKWN